MSVSEQRGVCRLCGESYEPTFSRGVHTGCAGVPELLDVCERLVVALISEVGYPSRTGRTTDALIRKASRLVVRGREGA